MRDEIRFKLMDKSCFSKIDFLFFLSLIISIFCIIYFKFVITSNYCITLLFSNFLQHVTFGKCMLGNEGHSFSCGDFKHVEPSELRELKTIELFSS